MGEHRESGETDGENRGAVDGGSRHETHRDPDPDDDPEARADGSGDVDPDPVARTDPDATTHVDADASIGGDGDRHHDSGRRDTRPAVGRNGGSATVDDVATGSPAEDRGPGATDVDSATGAGGRTGAPGTNGAGGSTDTGSAAVPAERTNGRDVPSDRDASNGSRAGPVADPAEESLSASLAPDESLQFVRDGTLLGDYRGPATVGVTDDRLLVVTDAGEFVSVGLERVSSVRSNPWSTVDVRGNDARLMFGLGYLLAVVGFLGVLAGSTSALTPALTLVSLGGLVAVDYVRREGNDGVPVGDLGLDLDSVVPHAVVERVEDAGNAVERLERAANATDRIDGLVNRVSDAVDRVSAAVDRLPDSRTRLDDRVGRDRQLLGAVGVLAAVPFVGILLLEGGFLVPFFALLTVGSIGLVVYTFRHGDSFDGFELDRRRQRTVTACLDDGREVTVRTDVESGLDRELAADVVATTGPRRSDADETR